VWSGTATFARHVGADAPIGDGLAWAPASFFEQDGTPVPTCTRGNPEPHRDRSSRTRETGAVGHEDQFLLRFFFSPHDGGRLCRRRLWAPYGLAGGCAARGFSRDVMPRPRWPASGSSNSIPSTG